MERRVLVTGCSGFTGRYMIKNLQENGYEVFGLSSRTCETEHFYKVDLLDSGSIARCIQNCKPDYVIHLAGISFVADNDGAKIYRSNLEGSYNLLKSLRDHAPNVRGILLASSANVYGNCGNKILTENFVY